MGRVNNESPITREIKSFLVDRRARQLSSSSIDFYSYYLDIFSRLLSEQAVTDLDCVTPGVLRACLDTFGVGHNRGGVHALYRTIKVFLNWYERELDGAWSNPLRKVAAPKNKLDPIPGVSAGEVNCMVTACGNDWYGKRDRAVLLFLFDTGVRRQECFDLNIEDIDLDAGTARIRHGKGDKPRTVYFGSNTAAALRRYLRGRSAVPVESPLWIDRNRHRLSDAGLRGILKRRAAACGIQNVPSAHDFRRGFALEMLRAGVDLVSVSRLLGHESLEVTRRYLALVEEDLERAHAAGSPVDRLVPARRGQ